MKEILLALLMTVCLTACGEIERGSDMVIPASQVSSIQELSEEADFALIRPEGIPLEEEGYYLISDNPQIAEYTFKVNSTQCFLRFANTDITTDISGLKGPEGTLFSDTEYETTYIENDDLKAQRWVTVDGQYVFCVLDSSTWEWASFDKICSQFMNMEPKNWNADVPFAAYQALKGNYDNADRNAYGAINIIDDHAGVYVIADQDDGSRIYWEMEAFLDGDRLVYDREQISQIIYDETAGQTVTTLLDNGGSGYIEVKGDHLIFTNAYSAELKNLILTRTDS